MKPQVEINLIYYTTRYRTRSPDRLRLFQTLVYGTILNVEGEPRGMRGFADFRMVKDDKNDFVVTFGADILKRLRIKTVIIGKSKKRMAAFRKKLESGKAQSGDTETFIVVSKGDL